jgi:membrane fusion protein (multidrug efflux system)
MNFGVAVARSEMNKIGVTNMVIRMGKRLSIVVALSLSALAGCGGQAAKDNQNNYAIPVGSAVVQKSELTLVRTYYGSLEGIRQAEPTAKIPETVIEVRVTEGDAVRAGQVLVEFDKYGPSSQLRQSEALYLQAKRDYEKYERLYEGKAVSERDRDNAKTQYEVAKATYEAARDQVEVRSPIEGTVTDVFVKRGQQVTAGRVLAVVAVLDTMRFTFDLPYFDARLITRGRKVVIHSQMDSTITGTGRVDNISESADPVTRMVTAEALVPNPGRILQPGMYVAGEVVMQEIPGALTVPRDALVTRDNKRGIFLVADSLAKFVPVVEGLTIGDRTEITSGVSQGDQIVTVGQHSLEDGMRINVEVTE